MKKKYVVKEQNGWWYEKTFYQHETVVELTDAEYESLKEQVKLEPAG